MDPPQPILGFEVGGFRRRERVGGRGGDWDGYGLGEGDWAMRWLEWQTRGGEGRKVVQVVEG